MYPVALDLLVDSVPPELHPARDVQGAKKIAFNGFDIVTPTEKLQYAWLDASGKRSEWSSTNELDAATLSRLSNGFHKPIVLYVKDEKGLVGETAFDAAVMLDIQPQAATGCAMSGAGSDGSSRGLVLVALALLALVIHRRRRAL